eukprot:1078933-Pleurochrysis_carterae.AAC.1
MRYPACAAASGLFRSFRRQRLQPESGSVRVRAWLPLLPLERDIVEGTRVHLRARARACVYEFRCVLVGVR